MLKRHNVVIGSIISSAIIILAIAWYVPLTTQEHTAVALKHATGTLLLKEGETVQQKFQADNRWQSGIVLYSTAPFLDDRQLQVRILDEHGLEPIATRLAGAFFSSVFFSR